jgi:DNA repair protein RadC
LAEILSPVLGSDAEESSTRLLDEFGTIEAIAAAPEHALARAFGSDRIFSTMFVAARAIVAAGMRERVHRSPVDSGDPAVLEYIKMRLSGLREERLVVIYLDGDRGFQSEEVFGAGTVDAISIRPRALFGRGLMLGSSAILLAHNHPSGVAHPSSLDIEMTRRIADHGRLLEIELLDHLIVGASEVLSMKRAGLL